MNDDIDQAAQVQEPDFALLEAEQHEQAMRNLCTDQSRSII
jgi:hypothetical protein